MKKISIIIPVYNAGKHLEQCLKSVIEQTYKNLEIILVNDGSTDMSKEICEEYQKKDPRIILLNQSNVGPAETRNRGLSIATGEYVSFIDSDDYIDKDFYNELLKRIIEDNSDISICKHVEVKNNQNIHMVYNYKEKIITSNNIMQLFLSGDTINAYLWNKLYRRELFENIRFENLKMLEDLDVMYRVLDKCKKISFVDKELYFYRCDNSNSLSKNCSKEMIDDYEFAINKMYDFFKERKYLFEAINVNKIIMYTPFFSSISCSQYYKNDEKFKESYLDFKKAFRYIKKEKKLKKINQKSLLKGFILYYNKSLYYEIYRKKMKK